MAGQFNTANLLPAGEPRLCLFREAPVLILERRRRAGDDRAESNDRAQRKRGKTR